MHAAPPVRDTLRMLPSADATVRLPEPAAEPIESGQDVRWLGDLVELPIVQRARTMGRALVFFVRAPYAFGQAWARGEHEIPNPGIAMATAASLMAVVVHQIRAALHLEASHTLLASVGETLGPYSMYLAHGLIAHVILRALGSRRGVQTSVGIALLAGAGPGLLAAMSLVATLLPLKLHFGADARLPDVAPRAILLGAMAVVFVSYVWFAVAFQLALAGAHGVSRWKGMFAGTTALVAFGVLCASVEHAEGFPRVTHMFGPHLSITLTKPHRIDPSFVW